MGVELQTRSFKFRDENNTQLQFVQEKFGPFAENASQAVRHCIAYVFIEIKLHGVEKVIQGLLRSTEYQQIELFHNE